MSTENTETVISINHVSKVYKLFEKPMDRLKESLSLTHKKLSHRSFCAGGYLARGAQRRVCRYHWNERFRKIHTGGFTARYHDVQSGEIRIDGLNIKDARIADLRGLIGNVNQEAILFNDTFFNNIAFGVENATMEQVVEAAKIANAHDFIMDTEKGYDTNIGDRGGKLSGGQRQRISIARAILKNPPILILDEATSALDTESERLVQEALERLMKTRTTIAIAHRLSTIRKCG